MVPAIEFRDVRLTRPGSVVALEHVTFAVEPGDIVALLGRSGSGKTTTLKLVNRLLLPDWGAVLVEGRDTREWDPFALRRRLGYVLQEIGLFPHLTVRQNVGIGPRIAGWSAERTRERVRELLSLVGLPEEIYGERWPEELSGGQRQRVGVARALGVDPPILLMDEPFGALDRATRSELQRELLRIQATLKKTVILVTHDLEEAFKLGDRIGVVDHGHLVAWDTPVGVARASDPRLRVLLASSG